MRGAMRDAPPALPRRQKTPALAIGLGVLGLMIVCMILVPALRPPPDAVNIDGGLASTGAPLPPSWRAPLGTDELGRDVAARVFAGLRMSLVTAVLAAALSLVIGLAVGLVAGLANRMAPWLDRLLSRAIDVTLALPVMLLAILAAAAVRAAAVDGQPPTRGGAMITLALLMSLIGWPTIARVTRARALVLARSEMVHAARALGATPLGILWRHVLPNTLDVISVLATVTVAQMVMAEVSMSFLGLGAPAPAASLGRMVFEGRVHYRTAPWLLLAPGLTIVLAVSTFHLINVGLRRRYAEAR